jgi:outer membrane lipoprotein-sorting protein
MHIEQYDTRDGQFFMKTSNGALAYKIWINDFNGKITKISATQSGEELFVREYDDYKKTNGIYFPQKIKMVRPLARQAVSIYYTRFQLNEAVDRNKFLITIPDHAEQIDFSNYTSGQ